MLFIIQEPPSIYNQGLTQSEYQEGWVHTLIVLRVNIPVIINKLLYEQYSLLKIMLASKPHLYT